jgi:hypothetical protein
MSNTDSSFSIIKSANKVNRIYEGLSYFDQYGGSVVLFFIITVILFIIWAYAKIIVNIQPIKDDWVNQRCYPTVIPFAGIINPPDGSTATEFTQENFNYCVQGILTSITGIAVAPLTYTMNMLNVIFEDLREAFQYLRSLIDSIRQKSKAISEEIFGRISNVTYSFFPIIIKLKDAFSQTSAILVSGLYTTVATYDTLKSVLGAVLQIIVIILIALAILVVICWLTLNFPVAIAGTVTFGVVIAFLAIIIAFCVDVLHIPVPGLPSAPQKPSCFDKNTLLKMNDGTEKKISEIEVGDLLEKNEIVTTKLKLDATRINMYDLFGIIVSDTHKIKYNEKWIFVYEHPYAIKLEKYNEPYIYCLNTESKEINIVSKITNTNHTFIDWDEIYEKELKILSKKINNFIKKDIHKKFDVGFKGDTLINMMDEDIEIKNLKPGMVLKNGSIIYGVVEINGKDLKQFSYNLGCIKIIASENISNLYINNLNKISEVTKEDKLYNLVTDNGNISINNILLGDYNSTIELFLDI